MKIYVTELTEYNKGKLYGKWLNLDDYSDSEELKEAVASVPKINPNGERNEFVIHDYELDYSYDPNFGEHPDLEAVFCYHELCEKYGKAFAVWFSCIKSSIHTDDYSEWENSFGDSFEGEFSSYNELAEHFVNEGLFGEIPDAIINYIDYEAIGNDLSFEYSIEDGYCFRL